jgi:hypothetical protein
MNASRCRQCENNLISAATGPLSLRGICDSACLMALLMPRACAKVWIRFLKSPPCPAKGVSMTADAKFDASLSYQARSLWGKSDYGNNAGNPLFLVAVSCNY